MSKKLSVPELKLDVPAVLLVLSMAFAWTINSGAPLEYHAVPFRFDYLLLGSCCVAAALAPKLTRKISEPKRPLALFAIGFVGVVLSALSLWGGVLIACVAALFAAVFQTMVLLRCFARLSQLRMTTVLLCLALWLCATGVLIVVITLLPSAFFQVVANGVSTMVVILFLAMPQRVSTAFFSSSTESTEDPMPQSTLPVGLFVVQFTVLFVIKACGVIASSHFTLASGLGFVVAALTVVAFFVYRNKIIQLKGLYNVSLLSAELALFAASIGTIGHFFAGLFNGAAYAFFAVFCFTVYCVISLRHGVDPTRLFAIAIACECFASMAGIQFYVAARDFGVDLVSILVFLSALLAVTFLFLFNDAQYRSDWGTKRSRPSVDSVIKYYYTLPDICTALAKQHSLSKREEMVLQLLAQKKSAPDIAAELFISVPTVKTHTQNIYRKFGIHSRAELFALLDIETPADDGNDWS